MNQLCVFLLFCGVAQAQVLARIKSRPEALHSSAVPAVKAVAPAPAAAHERRLIDVTAVKESLDKIAMENLWKVGEPADNTIVVSEEVGGAEVALFKAVLIEKEIPNSQEKQQFLSFENRPLEEGEDPQFGIYKNSQMLFRRKINPKQDNLLGAYIKRCCDMFKDLIDRIKALTTAQAIIETVQQVLNELKVPGVVIEKVMVQPKFGLFRIKDGQGNVRFTGTVSALSGGYLMLALTSREERVQISNGFGTEVNFKGRVAQVLARKLTQPVQSLTMSQITPKILQQINARCPNDPPSVSNPVTVGSVFSAKLVASDRTKPGDLNGCIYANSKLLVVAYDTSKIYYIQTVLDLNEMVTEDQLLPNSAVFDTILSQSLNKNANSVNFIRKSRKQTKSEIALTAESLSAVIKGALGGEPTDEPISDEEKGRVEDDKKKWLSQWSFKNGVRVNLFENDEEFIVEVARVNPATKSLTTTQFSLPKFNGFDQAGLLKQQISEFVSG